MLIFLWIIQNFEILSTNSAHQQLCTTNTLTISKNWMKLYQNKIKTKKLANEKLAHIWKMLKKYLYIKNKYKWKK